MGRRTMHGSSKYDFVKVKVWLGDNAEHYYVFSRFLLSQNLTVTKIPNHISIKIALDLKKLLVDNSLLDVSQSDLEENLFKLMEQRGFGEDYVKLYRMMTRFHHQRVPLVIIVCGTSCVGKSTVAAQISQRLNLPNVMQTDVVYELLRSSTDAPLASTPIWARDFSSSEELITEFCRECRVVRKGLAGDLKKALKDGKPIIIEGIHLDPNIYLMYDENNNAPDLNSSTDQQHVSSQKGKAAASVSENKGEIVKGPEPIIIPLVLNMAEFEHQALLEEWFSSCTISDRWQVQDKDKLMSNVKTIQDYLCSFNSKGLTVLNLSAATFAQTLDWLHGYLLEIFRREYVKPEREKINWEGTKISLSKIWHIHEEGGLNQQNNCYMQCCRCGKNNECDPYFSSVEAKFEDILDVDHFIDYMKDDVRIVRDIPEWFTDKTEPFSSITSTVKNILKYT